MSETLRSDVLISGGGLVGQALALALAHHGLSVQIVDPADPVTTIAPGFDGRASAIASATWQMFEVLGLADRLAGHGCA
ncbi:MAG: FAD-dependent monooxygenase, partial [Sphingopyxis sp.]